MLSFNFFKILLTKLNEWVNELNAVDVMKETDDGIHSNKYNKNRIFRPFFIWRSGHLRRKQYQYQYQTNSQGTYYSTIDYRLAVLAMTWVNQSYCLVCGFRFMNMQKSCDVIELSGTRCWCQDIACCSYWYCCIYLCSCFVCIVFAEDDRFSIKNGRNIRFLLHLLE